MENVSTNVSRKWKVQDAQEDRWSAPGIECYQLMKLNPVSVMCPTGRWNSVSAGLHPQMARIPPEQIAGTSGQQLLYKLQLCMKTTNINSSEVRRSSVLKSARSACIFCSTVKLFQTAHHLMIKRWRRNNFWIFICFPGVMLMIMAEWNKEEEKRTGFLK